MYDFVQPLTAGKIPVAILGPIFFLEVHSTLRTPFCRPCFAIFVIKKWECNKGMGVIGRFESPTSPEK